MVEKQDQVAGPTTSRPTLSDLFLPRLCHPKVPQSCKISPLAKDQVFSLVSLMKCKIFEFKAQDIVSITSEESPIQRIESVAYR